ncbi:MAG: cupredoxin domain-containing protein [Nanoarchaeota archaeon]
MSIFGVIIMLLVFVGGCAILQQQKEPPASYQQTGNEQQIISERSMGDGEIRESKEEQQQEAVEEIAITASSWKFEPSTIKVKQGTKVKLSITSIDVNHGFSLRAYNIKVRLQPGKTETIDFIADQKGTFEFFCSVYCGIGHPNMQGMLIVE